MLEFPHPSRPGFHGVALSPDQSAGLAALVDAIVPGNEHYPSATVALVPQFIAERASIADVEVLDSILASAPTLSDPVAAREVVARVEEQEPLVFAWLRELTYHGYYASKAVLAVMARRGYTYHGAPQPLGYTTGEDLQLPSGGRGSYIKTEAVTRATL